MDVPPQQSVPCGKTADSAETELEKKKKERMKENRNAKQKDLILRQERANVQAENNSFLVPKGANASGEEGEEIDEDLDFEGEDEPEEEAEVDEDVESEEELELEEELEREEKEQVEEEVECEDNAGSEEEAPSEEDKDSAYENDGLGYQPPPILPIILLGFWAVVYTSYYIICCVNQ